MSLLQIAQNLSCGGRRWTEAGPHEMARAVWTQRLCPDYSYSSHRLGNATFHLHWRIFQNQKEKSASSHTTEPTGPSAAEGRGSARSRFPCGNGAEDSYNGWSTRGARPGALRGCPADPWNQVWVASDRTHRLHLHLISKVRTADVGELRKPVPKTGCVLSLASSVHYWSAKQMQMNSAWTFLQDFS